MIFRNYGPLNKLKIENQTLRELYNILCGKNIINNEVRSKTIHLSDEDSGKWERNDDN